MALRIRSTELQRALRKAYNDKLTGYISLSRNVNDTVQYSTLTFMEGQLLKANISSFTGQRAFSTIANLEFDKVAIVHSAVSGDFDVDIPHIASVLETSVSGHDTLTDSPRGDSSIKAMVDETVDIIRRVYGDKGVDKVREIIAKLPPASNPSLFLDRCEELLVPLFGEFRSRELMRGAHRRLS